MRFQLGTSPPRGTVGGATFPFRVGFRLFVSPPATMAVRGRVLTLVSLVIAPAFPFNRRSSSCTSLPATLAVRGRFLTVVRLIIAPLFVSPPRHAGGTREVFDGGLRYYSDCVFCFVFFFVKSQLELVGVTRETSRHQYRRHPSRWVLAQTEILLDIGTRESSSWLKTKISNPPREYSIYHIVYRFCSRFSLQPVSSFTADQACNGGFQPPIGRTHS